MVAAVLAVVLLAPGPVSATGGVSTIDYTVLDRKSPESPDAVLSSYVAPGLVARRAAQREVLVELYDATRGRNWDDNTNWLTSQPVGDWFGVTVDADGLVVEIVLWKNGLVGSIPPSLGNLTSLHRLSLLNEGLSGPIPPQLGGLVNLEILDLGDNDLSGSIPSRLGDLASLKQLYLDGNALTGSIPDLSGLVELKVLKLERNQLSGALPVALLTLPELVELRLGNNGFDRPLPQIPAAAPDDPHKLEILDLNYNDLTGGLPSSLSNLGNLTELRLWGSDLSGPIPPQIGELSRLRSLSLGHNRLSGELPEELAELSNLTSLNLSSNNLSGPIPPQLGELSRLKKMLLGSNRFEGSIPPQLGNLRALGLLLLGANRLTGEFPFELGNLDRLTGLDLVHNNVTGCVPNALNRDTTTVTFNTGLGFCDASLSALSVTPAQLDEPFNPDVLTYTATTTSDTTPVTLIATPTSSAATIEYLDTNGDPITDADDQTPGLPITLTETDTTVQIKVSVQGAESKTYTLSIYRPPELSISASTVSEGVGTVTLKVTMNRRSSRIVTVAYNTADGTTDDAAVDGEDYTTKTGTVTFAPDGELTQDVTVEIIDDVIDEPEESFTVNLTNAVNGEIDAAKSAATVTIIDNDPWPIVSVAALTVGEGDESARLTVTMRGRSSKPVSVRYYTEDDTAVVPGDYTTNSGMLTFAPSEADVQTQQVAVGIIDDIIDEPDESFTVHLRDLVYGRFVDGRDVAAATVNIIDDDEPSVSIADVNVAVDEGDRSATLTIALTGGSSTPVSVGYYTVDGTAVAGADYTHIEDSVTFAPSDDEQTHDVTVAIIEDIIDDADEAFTLRLRNPVNARINPDKAIGTVVIIDNDPLPVLSIADLSVDEDDESATLTVTMTGRSSTPVSVDYDIVGGSAVVDQDYRTSTDTLIFRPNGPLTQRVTVPIINDSVHEDAESFTVRLERPVNAEIDPDKAAATVTIIDDDPLSLLSIVRAPRRVEGASRVRLRVTLDPVNDREEVTVLYQTSDGTASAGEDYVAVSGMLTFEPGVSEQHVTVAIIDDVFDEADRETFVVTLSDAVGAAVGVGTATVTIEDDDEVPSLSITGGGNVNEDVGSVTLDVILNAESRREVSVRYRTPGDSAVAGEDYEPNTGTLVFEPGETEKTVTVVVTDDDLDETRVEDFRVVLENPDNATVGVGTAIVAIEDDDRRPRLSIVDDVEVDEGSGYAEFVVELSAVSGRTVTVDYATSDGTAHHGQDYSSVSSVLTFKAGTTRMTVSVPVSDDLSIESNEDFRLTLSNPKGARLGDAEATALILNNDRPTVSISLAPDLPVVEGGVAQLVVALSESNTEETVVRVVIGDISTTAADYYPLDPIVLFEVGVTSATIPVMIKDDSIDEYMESFTVSVVDADNADFAAAFVTVEIIDDDDPPSVSILDLDDGFETAEGTSVVIPVKLLDESGKVVTITYTTRQINDPDQDTATADIDYETTAGTLKFLPGTTTQDIVILIHSDMETEGTETFEVVLTAADGADLFTEGTIATVSITDVTDNT